MSFENGYNIKDYIQPVIDAYNKDKTIFDKILKILNIYMNRKDWPTSFGEFSYLSSDIMKYDIELLCRNILMFDGQEEEGHPDLQGWKEKVDVNFIGETILFAKILAPIIENYYEYINNPIGIKQVVKMNSSDGWSNIKIFRIDGKSIDFRLSEYDINMLCGVLKSGDSDGN